LFDVTRVVSLEVNTESTKHVVISLHQNARRSHDLMIAKKSF